MQRRMFVT